MTGKVARCESTKDLGSSRTMQGRYFFHQSALYGEGIDDLREDHSVEFDVGQGPKRSLGPRPCGGLHVGLRSTVSSGRSVRTSS
jgi:cold shock CspA family protein